MLTNELCHAAHDPRLRPFLKSCSKLRLSNRRAELRLSLPLTMARGQRYSQEAEPALKRASRFQAAIEKCSSSLWFEIAIGMDLLRVMMSKSLT
ncbi:hypothetical protein FXB41_15215 [Bradyrhizobium canariense]|uniref:hypothetical protein n=1 Tax=Bradyrhizobium canariense TaxID=255045 RepID=UPI001CA59420|nr:hypothetical protein [Bradyrhizobium canariense]MBW5436081.1 hypothetical protein [Bradyrhizobium canariense]